MLTPQGVQDRVPTGYPIVTVVGVAVFLASSSTANPCTVVHVGFHAWRSSSSSSNQAQQVEGIDELWSEQGGYWEM
jgi:hypothetical protein